MSDQHFLRCNCQRCGSPIEFPAQGVGMRIECPHCGQETLLCESEAAPAADLPPPSEVATEISSAPLESALASPPVHEKRSPLVAVTLVLLALVGAWQYRQGRDRIEAGTYQPDSWAIVVSLVLVVAFALLAIAFVLLGD